MHKAKTFFLVAAGFFLLALSYHLGARNATAQAPGNPVVALIPYNVFPVVAAAVTANGDVYTQRISALDGPWTLAGNVFAGGPVPVQAETWGAMKSRYRGAPGAAQPAEQGR